MNREWTLLIAAPAPLWSTNDAHQKGEMATSANRRRWREAGYRAAQRAGLPTGLDRIRLACRFHFPDRGRRDALNYSETAKPLTDALGRPFVQKPTKKKPQGGFGPGWSLIPDDVPRHLQATELSIGPTWRRVLAKLPADLAVTLQSKYGGVTVAITEVTDPYVDEDLEQDKQDVLAVLAGWSGGPPTYAALAGRIGGTATEAAAAVQALIADGQLVRQGRQLLPTSPAGPTREGRLNVRAA